MKRHLGLIGITVAVIVSVAAYTQVARSDSAPAPVTARVTRGSIVDMVDATGTIQPVNTVQASVTPQAIALSFGVAAAVGVFFGFYPAHKAARLNPIEALRYE